MTHALHRLPRRAPTRIAGLIVSALIVGACAATPAPGATSSVPSPSLAATARPAPSLEPSVAPSVAPNPKVSPDPAAADSKVHHKLVAAKDRFDLAAMSAPADKTWHIDFDMQDDKFGRTPYHHDVAIAAGLTKDARNIPFEGRIFTSTAYTLGKYTIDVPGLPAGTYTFWCTVHPGTMAGTLTIE